MSFENWVPTQDERETEWLWNSLYKHNQWSFDITNKTWEQVIIFQGSAQSSCLLMAMQTVPQWKSTLRQRWEADPSRMSNTGLPRTSLSTVTSPSSPPVTDPNLSTSICPPNASPQKENVAWRRWASVVRQQFIRLNTNREILWVQEENGGNPRFTSVWKVMRDSLLGK